MPNPLSEPLPPRSATPAASSPAAQVVALTKTFGDGDSAVHALRGVDLAIQRARITAVMGQSGSGKSTLLQTMAGLEPPTSGRVLLGDQEITGMNDETLTRLRRTRMGFVFQSFNLLPALDALENIRLPFLLAGTGVSADTEAWIEILLTRLGLADRAHHRPQQLSGGQQQRVAIARALVTRPDVLFADEPTGSLDSASSRDVLELLRAASGEWGQTIVLVTHDPVAASAADRVVRMSDGVIVDDWAGGSAESIAERMLEAGAR
ncbi:ABC transporter ATP-binding protein [Amnibacterium flavum]|uniref:Peptide ABC transporter ATP-binding protein n=1 Tax=Amnibacterium flavum TaxID=2173173 RepID=A0A2V1HSM7_9MICO|nr:ABC transporter ATP-binding protein [Amnibacterium flavum]PVZ93960.1 peptide ABC transporter ATP-binding protein [Amnibacterium flavum]